MDSTEKLEKLRDESDILAGKVRLFTAVKKLVRFLTFLLVPLLSILYCYAELSYFYPLQIAQGTQKDYLIALFGGFTASFFLATGVYCFINSKAGWTSFLKNPWKGFFLCSVGAMMEASFYSSMHNDSVYLSFNSVAVPNGFYYTFLYSTLSPIAVFAFLFGMGCFFNKRMKTSQKRARGKVEAKKAEIKQQQRTVDAETQRQREAEQMQQDQKVRQQIGKQGILNLKSLVGLTSLKGEIKNWILQLEYQQARGASAQTSHHMVLYGNPGTGKTEVARYLTDVLYGNGVIDKRQLISVERKDLVAEYVGQTAGKTQEAIDSAMGGILFVDEAYTLMGGSSRDFGKEALETIMTAMENNRNNFIVIFAGYKDKMDELLDLNQGLRSRIAHYFTFPDYTEEELAEICERMADSKGYRFDPGTKEELCAVFRVKKNDKNFGNARGARNYLDHVIVPNLATAYQTHKEDPCYDIDLITPDMISKD